VSDYSRSSISSGYNTTSSLNTELTKIETAIATKGDKSGFTMTSDLDMNSNSILNVANGIAGTDAVNLNQLQAGQTATNTNSILTNSITATASQTLFTVPSYTLGANLLSVYVNGQYQYLSSSYDETSTTSITFRTGLNVGDVVYVVANQVPSSSDIVAGANLVDYTANYAGAVQQQVQDKLDQTVSVKDFGATGNGTTDDTAAIQAALDTQQKVYAPTGTYSYTALTIPRGAQLVGDGYESTTFDCASGSSGTSSISFLANATASLRVVGVLLEGIRFQTSASLGSGVDWTNCEKSIMQGCSIKGFPESGLRLGMDSTTFSGSYYNTFISNEIRENGKGVHFFNGGGFGSANTNTFIGGQINANTTHGIHFEGDATNVCFYGMSIENNAYMLLHEGTGGGCVYSGCRFEGASGTRLVTLGASSDDILFSGNTLSGTTTFSNLGITNKVSGNSGVGFENRNSAEPLRATTTSDVTDTIQQISGQTSLMQQFLESDGTIRRQIKSDFSENVITTSGGTCYATQVEGEANTSWLITANGDQYIGDGTVGVSKFLQHWDATTINLLKNVRFGAEVRLGSTIKVLHGTGTPEAAITAVVGSTYHRDDGGAGTSFYVKETGTGNTGWVAK